MTGPSLLFLTAIFLIIGGSAGEAAQTTGPSTRGAISKGDVNYALSVRETKAQEAEKNGDWEVASNAYRATSHAAKVNGQYQKAIAYGNKAVEMG